MLAELVWPRVLTMKAERALTPNANFAECFGCPKMVVVPAGEFTMGSPGHEQGRYSDERPQHKVTIPRAFAVSKFEVTFDEWDACVIVGGCAWPAPETGWGRGTQPAINVSWDDAQQYMAWLSRRTGKTYRLLSEAEWEYAARAGSADTAYFWGDEIGDGNANCDGCGSQWDGKQTAPVGSFAASPFGLHDMNGNVFEWVQDCYQPYGEAPSDGSARTSEDCKLRIVRGGSWLDEPRDLRSAVRFRNPPDVRYNSVGFRVARTLTP
jgi:formylglycine-generating enzyme required for sulfatase activity